MLRKDFIRKILFDELVLMLMFLGCLCVNSWAVFVLIKQELVYPYLNWAFSNL